MQQGDYHGCAGPLHGKSLCLQNRGYCLYQTILSPYDLQAISTESTVVEEELVLTRVISHSSGRMGTI